MHHAGFVHLHCHTYYSLLDGACPVEALARKAKEYRMPALAMTDHGNLYATVEFYETVSKAGIKPIIGCECYLLPKGSRKERERGEAGLTHLTLLVKNREGYRNLCKLVTSSHLEGFYYKPRIDMEILSEYNEGIVALSGCLRGYVSSLLLEERDQEAEEFATSLATIFTHDRFYIELMDNGLPEQQKINPKLVELARRHGWPLVATNDVHYLEKTDADAQDALLCIQTGKTIQEEKRLKLFGNEFYFKSPEEMAKLFAFAPEAVSNTVELAKNLNLELEFGTYHFPKYTPPHGEDLSTHLIHLSQKGLEELLPKIAHHRGKKLEDIRALYEERLSQELEMIARMGFAGYFLIVADFIHFARSRKLPVGPGRGSAAGSLVAYALRITNIDPLAHDLLFERFLNPERISMPDMDIDFCMRRRDEVIHYVAQKYGSVSQIITFGKMKARAVVRDVGRVLGVAYGDVDRLAKLVPATLGMTLERALEVEPRILETAKQKPQMKRLLEIAKNLEGFPRHASTHAAGVVISDKPLTDYLPLGRGQHEEVVTQFDMKAVEHVGLIKFDFLGLKTLTTIDDTIKLIKKHRGIDIDIDDIPLDDPKVYQKLSEGDTGGVFQLESQGMTALIQKLKPTLFADIVALVALFRPGPLGSGMVEDFTNRKHGKTPIRYELPELEPILRDTYGVIVYQEQVMRIASVLANFSLGDADILRRAMGKKRREEMMDMRERFLKGALEKKITKQKAERIFELMEKFAEYGFNKSHSAAYALVAYQTAYLKTHYTTEYMAALLTCEHGNADKVLESIANCRSHQITVLPPDVNESDSNFSVVGQETIRFGLGAVKNVGEAAIQSILEARKEHGPFLSLTDFCERIDARKVNKRVIESLIKCGAFDFTKTHRAALMARLDAAMEQASSTQRDRSTGQSRLFDLVADAPAASAEEGVAVPAWQEPELLLYEKEALGFYITGHPLAQYEELLSAYANADTSTLLQRGDRQEVKVGGVVARLREITTRRGERMGFVGLEDVKGMVEVVVFSDVYAQSISLLKGEKPIFVVGTTDSDGETVKIIAQSIFLLEEASQHLTTSVHFYLHTPEATSHYLSQLRSVLSRYPGKCPGFIHVVAPESTETVMRLPEGLTMAPSPELMSAVHKLFGHNVTRFSSA